MIRRRKRPALIHLMFGAMARAQEIFTTDEMKVFSGLSPSELMGRHLHKFVQVMNSCKLYFPFFFVYVVLRSDSSLSLFFFRCWGRAPIFPRSILLRRLRSSL